MKKLVFALVSLSLISCSSTDKVEEQATSTPQKFPVVTIETSGDLYFEDGGGNIQMDLFGKCATGKNMIYVEVDGKKAATPCKKGRYRFSMNLPQSFFKGLKKKKGRSPSSKYVMKEISAYHHKHKKLSATSYILIDRKKKEVKSVINKQVKYERIPTGDWEPVTQFNAFGSCTTGATVTIDLTSPDRFGHEVSKYDDSKECQSSGFYFLTQVDGLLKKGTMFNVYEQKMVIPSTRNPASEKKKKPTLKPLFEWSLPLK